MKTAPFNWGRVAFILAVVAMATILICAARVRNYHRSIQQQEGVYQK